jgi:acyl-CoA synthetase (NDP forming)
VFRAACRRAGAVLADETEEFFDAIEALAVAGRARGPARSVAVLTVSGGPSVVVADTAEREGLLVPALDDATRAALRAVLPPFAAVANPVDLTPQVDPARIAEAVDRVLRHPDIGGAIVVNVGLDFPEFADAIVASTRSTAKPAVAFVADAPRIAERLRAGGVPVLASPERAVRAFRVIAGTRPVAAPIPSGRPTLPADVLAAIGRTSGPLPYAQARRALEAVGLTFTRESIATTVEGAVAAAEGLGYPVVLKADVPGLLHKTEAGAVRLGLTSAAAVREAFREVTTGIAATGVVVQRQVVRGVELLVGARRDETFGPVVVFGAGGVLTEVLRDVSLRLAPLGAEEAEEMLHEGLRPRLLAGPRGLPPVEPAAVIRAIVAVGALIAAAPRIVEIDVNPLIAAGADVVAVDALVIVGETPAEKDRV